MYTQKNTSHAKNFSQDVFFCWRESFEALDEFILRFEDCTESLIEDQKKIATNIPPVTTCIYIYMLSGPPRPYILV